MSSITAADQLFLEKILRMGGGYVLDFTNETFSRFFMKFKIAIDNSKYMQSGSSKAKRMRSFWRLESDDVVAPVLSELLDVYEAYCASTDQQIDTFVLRKCREIAARLSGKGPYVDQTTAQGFLDTDVEVPNLQELPIESMAVPIIHARLKEAQDCLSVGAYLSVIFQCGSVLEGVLLGAAQRTPEKFNRSKVSPKNDRDGKVKSFHEWSLSDFIDVAYDVGVLKADVQKFSHGLRDFRNYIHPYQQMISGFSPDDYTAKVCLQVLKVALADVAGKR